MNNIEILLNNINSNANVFWMYSQMKWKSHSIWQNVFFFLIKFFCLNLIWNEKNFCNTFKRQVIGYFVGVVWRISCDFLPEAKINWIKSNICRHWETLRRWAQSLSSFSAKYRATVCFSCPANRIWLTTDHNCWLTSVRPFDNPIRRQSSDIIIDQMNKDYVKWVFCET